jgi:AcrR family transcriptional regulator
MGIMTFKNLEKEKRQRILQAAYYEFNRVTFLDILISNIVVKAQIPRGSFYQYFDSIYDLFSVLLIHVFGKEERTIHDYLSEKNGDLKQALKARFAFMIKSIHNYSNGMLIKNMALVKTIKPNFLYPPCIEPQLDEEARATILRLIRKPSSNLIEHIELCFCLSLQAYLQKPSEKEMIVVFFQQQIDLLLDKEDIIRRKNEVIVKNI